jgi:hypothetical protein
MSAFRVGQRVRILYSRHYPELGGTEGVVVGDLSVRFSTLIGWYNCYLVAPDMWGSHCHPKNPAGSFGPAPCQLAPLQYDGNKAVSWSECLWQPEGEHA